MTGQVSILHLRQVASATARDGATRMMLDTIRLFDREKFVAVPCLLLNRKPGEKNFAREDVRDGLKCRLLGGNRFLDLGLIRVLLRTIKKERVSIVHGHDYKADFYGLILKAFFPRIRLVGTVHGYVTNTRKGAAYCWLDRKIVRFFDRIIIVASSQKKFFPPKYADKIRLIHNALDTGYWRRPDKPGRETGKDTARFSVGFVGRISAEKGWRGFVETAKLLAARNPSVFFLVAGDGPDMREMLALVEDSGLASRFEFKGVVEDMRGFYAALDVLLAPSRTEGLPVAQLEANAMGIPVVATNVGGVPDLILHGHNGLLAAEGDVTELARLVATLIDNRESARRMGDNGRRRVAKFFSLEKQVESLQDVYLDLLLRR